MLSNVDSFGGVSVGFMRDLFQACKGKPAEIAKIIDDFGKRDFMERISAMQEGFAVGRGEKDVKDAPIEFMEMVKSHIRSAGRFERKGIVETWLNVALECIHNKNHYIGQFLLEALNSDDLNVSHKQKEKIQANLGHTKAHAASLRRDVKGLIQHLAQGECFDISLIRSFLIGFNENVDKDAFHQFNEKILNAIYRNFNERGVALSPDSIHSEVTDFINANSAAIQRHLDELDKRKETSLVAEGILFDIEALVMEDKKQRQVIVNLIKDIKTTLTTGDATEIAKLLDRIQIQLSKIPASSQYEADIQDKIITPINELCNFLSLQEEQALEESPDNVSSDYDTSEEHEQSEDESSDYSIEAEAPAPSQPVELEIPQKHRLERTSHFQRDCVAQLQEAYSKILSGEPVIIKQKGNIIFDSSQHVSAKGIEDEWLRGQIRNLREFSKCCKDADYTAISDNIQKFQLSEISKVDLLERLHQQDQKTTPQNIIKAAIQPINDAVEAFHSAVAEAKSFKTSDSSEAANIAREKIITAFESLQAVCREAEDKRVEFQEGGLATSALDESVENAGRIINDNEGKVSRLQKALEKHAEPKPEPQKSEEHVISSRSHL